MKKLLGKIKFANRHMAFRITLILLIVILPLNLLALQSVINMNRELKEQVRLSVKNVLDVYMTSLDTELTKADTYIYNLLMEDEDALEMQHPKSDFAYQNARIWTIQKMKENMPAETGNCGYFIYLDNDFIFANQQNKERDIRVWLQNNQDSQEISKRWQMTEIEGHQYIIRKNEMKQIVYGAFLDFEDFENKILSSINYEQAEVYISATPENQVSNNSVTVSAGASKLDWYVSVTVNDVSVMHSADIWKHVQTILVILCLACAPAMYLLFRKYILVPINELNHAHHELEIGNREYRICQKANFVETQTAFDSFNQMADNIKDLRLANMEKELQKKQLELDNKELELENLQLQIRPHFLLNTFNLIYNLASRGQISDVQDMILYLSNYFRHIFRNGHKLEMFGKELKLIEGYEQLAKLRYPNRVELVYEIDPDVMMVRVPPLLIHNFVENAIKHGLEDDASVCVILSAEYEKGWVTVEIQDDGKGISEEIVKQINEECMVFEEGKHVGLSNSLKRLKLFYGDTASLHVESEFGEGTIFSLRFPYNLEVDEDETDVTQ